MEQLSPAEKRAQSVEMFTKLATGGLTLLMAYVGLKPILSGVPTSIHNDAIGSSILDISPYVDAAPWFASSVVLSLIPFVWLMTKRIPRRAIFATEKGQLVDSDWKNVSGQGVVLQFARECAASGSGRSNGIGQE